jgi:argininosuccinate lyase
LIGLLVGLLTTLKGLPSTYDKDLQEDKEGVFNAFDTLMIVLPVMTGVISTLKLQPERMAAQLEPGLIATDIADYLVKKGLPFRQAHHIVGEIVQLSETSGVPLTELSLAQLQAISPLFAPDVAEAFSVAGSLAARNVTGGTAPAAVREQIAFARRSLG